MIANDRFVACFGIVPVADAEALPALVRHAVRQGFAIVAADDATTPMCTLTPRQAKVADLDARDAARQAGHPRWDAVRHPCGVAHALTNAQRAAAVVRRLMSSHGRINIGVEVGRSRMVVVHADTAGQVAGFLAEWAAATGLDLPGHRPTVTARGTSELDDGGQFWFTVPDHLDLAALPGRNRLRAASGWTAVWKDHHALVPPSVGPQGPYVITGQVEVAPRWLLDRIQHSAHLEKEFGVTDQFQSAAPAAPEPKHDRLGRYLLPDPTTGEERAWTRVSTIARTLADEYHLTQWKLRMAVKGVAVRPDLIAGAVAADPEDNRSDLDSIVKQAMDAAESKTGANFGTALHSFTRRLDDGEPVTTLSPPQPLDRDLGAYASLFKTAGISVRHSERVVVLPELGVAGRFDRIVAQPPGVTKSRPLCILDLKTGKDLSHGWLEIAIQQALYAHAPLMWDLARGCYEPMPQVDQHRALVLHLPVGKAQPRLYGVDIVKGWAHVQLALQVRQARSGARKLAWLVEPDDPATVALHHVCRAASREELAQLWEQLNKRGLWSEEVNTAAMARFQHLQTVTV